MGARARAGEPAAAAAGQGQPGAGRPECPRIEEKPVHVHDGVSLANVARGHQANGPVLHGFALDGAARERELGLHLADALLVQRAGAEVEAAAPLRVRPRLHLAHAHELARGRRDLDELHVAAAHALPARGGARQRSGPGKRRRQQHAHQQLLPVFPGVRRRAAHARDHLQALLPRRGRDAGVRRAAEHQEVRQLLRAEDLLENPAVHGHRRRVGEEVADTRRGGRVLRGGRVRGRQGVVLAGLAPGAEVLEVLPPVQVLGRNLGVVLALLGLLAFLGLALLRRRPPRARRACAAQAHPLERLCAAAGEVHVRRHVVGGAGGR